MTNQKPSEENCVFCKIIKGEIPYYKIYEDDLTLAFLDIEPFDKGHTLIIPKKHFENIQTLDDEYAAQILITGRELVKVYEEELDIAGFNFFQNNGYFAGQRVMHYHMHLLPRYKNSYQGGISSLQKMHDEPYKTNKQELESLSQQLSARFL